MRFTRAGASLPVLSMVTATLIATSAGPDMVSAGAAEQAQTLPPNSRAPFTGPTPAPAPVEKIGPDLLRIGSIRIDLKKRELSVAGVVNDVQILEFLANTKGGFKAYESAIELDTNAVNFNVACLLIGLDPARAVRARQQFDPQAPQGDPVELFVEWDSTGSRRRVRAEQLIYSRVTKLPLSEGPWVYTGSSFVSDTTRYLAEVDGTLVGFMHTPAPIIESPRPLDGAWGDSMINPQLELKPGTQVQLVLRALPRQAAAPPAR
jgi:hypothetical protein